MGKVLHLPFVYDDGSGWSTNISRTVIFDDDLAARMSSIQTVDTGWIDDPLQIKEWVTSILGIDIFPLGVYPFATYSTVDHPLPLALDNINAWVTAGLFSKFERTQRLLALWVDPDFDYTTGGGNPVKGDITYNGNSYPGAVTEVRSPESGIPPHAYSLDTSLPMSPYWTMGLYEDRLNITTDVWVFPEDRLKDDGFNFGRDETTKNKILTIDFTQTSSDATSPYEPNKFIGQLFVSRSGASLGSSFATFWNAQTQPEPPTPPTPGPDNPYNPGGTTKPDEDDKGTWETGDGPFEPEPSRLYTTFPGLFRVYAMTVAQTYLLGQKLWNGTILDDIAKYFDNPMDVIMGIVEIPFDVASSSATDIKFNWLPSWADGPINVQGHPVMINYQQVSFGEIAVPRYSGSFYDFQPYTQAQVYIPYVGYVPIKFSEIVGSTVKLDYVIDVITGAGVAYLSSGKRGMIGVYNCNVGRNLPLTSRNFTELYLAIAKAALVTIGASAVGAVAGMAAGAGAAGIGAAAAGAGASEALVATSSVGEFPATYSTSMVAVPSGSIVPTSGPPIDFNRTTNPNKNPMPVLEGKFAQSALNGAMNSNIPIQRSGAFDAVSGRCAAQNAALFISIPHQNLPDNYAELFGFPSNIGGVCSDFTGYTQFRKVFLQVEANATQAEIDEIESMMIGGIVI